MMCFLCVVKQREYEMKRNSGALFASEYASPPRLNPASTHFMGTPTCNYHAVATAALTGHDVTTKPENPIR